MGEPIHVELIDAAHAAELAAQAGLAQLPGVLHATYLLADASRDPELQPTFIRVRRGNSLWWHGLHRRRIAGTAWWDASSPYGYGGPLSNTSDVDFLSAAWHAYVEWMRSQRVVVEYVRFHPMVGNERWYGGKVSPNRQVVWIDLTERDFPKRYAPRLRGTLKKAQSHGLRYQEVALSDDHAAFGVYYRQAMLEIGADPFFQFDVAYFTRLAEHPGARLGICTADSGCDWLAACLVLDGEGVTEYHLAATCAAGRRVGASSFALHQASLAAQMRGQRVFYLGGGTNALDDNPLLFFKAGFSPLRSTYKTGAHVFDALGFEELKRHFPDDWALHPDRPIFYRKV